MLIQLVENGFIPVVDQVLEPLDARRPVGPRDTFVNGVERRGLFEELGLEPTAAINGDQGRAETYLNPN